MEQKYRFIYYVEIEDVNKGIKKVPSIKEGTHYCILKLDYKADFTVLIILAAILYGSPFEAGLLSSNQPFHPF